jgi:hypothetical protein
MSDDTWENWFEQQVDAMAHGERGLEAWDAPQALRADLSAAERLAAVDLSSESRVYASLRARLAQQAAVRVFPQQRVRRQTIRPAAFTWAASAVVLLAMLLIFHQPVLAAVQRALGYGYLPETGFIRLSDTMLIKGPVRQEHGGASLLVQQGVADRQRTRLWIETSQPTPELASTWMEMEDGFVLKVEAIESGPHQRDVLVFGRLGGRTGRAVLHIPGGWQLPLDWGQAGQMGLAPTQVNFPYPSNTPYSSDPPCTVVGERARVCVAAVYRDPSGTRVLLRGEGIPPGSRFDWGAAVGMAGAVLKGDYGRDFALVASETQEGDLLLRFAPLPADIQVAHFYWPAPGIRVDGSSLMGTVEVAFRLPEYRVNFSPTPVVVSGQQPVPVPAPHGP